MTATLDDDLRRFHGQFDAEHDSGRRRLLAALAEQKIHPVGTRGVRQLAGRRLGSFAAAAAVALAVYVVFFAGGTHGVTWAAVLDNLNSIISIAWQQQTIVSAESYADDEDFVGPWDRAYLKAPHLYRHEEWIAGTSPPTDQDSAAARVTIWRVEEGRDVVLHLLPQERRATRQIVSRDEPERTSVNVPNQVWLKLQSLQVQDVHELGQAEFDGVQVVGFESPSSALFSDGAEVSGPDGTVRLWVDEQTAVPVRIELRFQRDGQYFTTVITDVEWNSPISDALFEVPEADGWKIEDEVAEPQRGPKVTGRLKPGVTLRIVSSTGEVVLSEEQVDLVTIGCVDGEYGRACTLTASMTSEGERLLGDYTAAHIGETVTIMFNEETIGQPRIQFPISKTIRIDFAETELAVEEFAQLMTEVEQ